MTRRFPIRFPMIRHKFNASPVKEEDGQHFASKLEWHYFKLLQLRQKTGDILFFLRQVPFYLPGNKKYFVDFCEFLKDGQVVFTDTKGMMTPLSKLKIDQVESLYPIKINIVTKV